MFFYLSKIFWMVAAPLSLIWFLLVIGFALRPWKSTLSNKILIGTAGIFLFFGAFPVGYNAMVMLESQYARPTVMPTQVDGIIVLGGAFNATLSEKTGMVSANGNVNRMIDFIDLSRRYPTAKAVFAGGTGSPYNQDYKEADAAAKFMEILGFDTSRVIFERNSRNTYENITFAKNMVEPKQGEKWIVVTSSSHMPRALGIFEKQGWDVIPYPSSPKTDGEYQFMPNPFGVIGNFFMTGMAMKEVIGGAIYYFTGKSAFLLPLHSLNSKESSNTANKE